MKENRANEETMPVPPALTAEDLQIILKLVARANIAVGDLPAILGTLQRLELAAKMNSALYGGPAAS